jgi:lactate dehydrogenase-like 2-hydroxyacid dehydrogenase
MVPPPAHPTPPTLFGVYHTVQRRTMGGHEGTTKRGKVFVLGSAASSPHIRDGIAASEFEWHELQYTRATTDAELEPFLGTLRETDFLCVGGDGFVDARILRLCPRVRIVSVNGVGYDGVDVGAVESAGVWLANAPVLREACADMAVLLMLAAMRKAAAGYRLARGAGPPGDGWDWGAMRNIVGDDPQGKTLGLIGFGRIGQTFAAKAQAAFGMRIIYYDPVKEPPVRTRGGADAGGSPSPPYNEWASKPRWVPFDELLATSDVVSMHANLSTESRGMMGPREFGLMKPTAYFVNMSRGGLVQEEALGEALGAGEIQGAGIDVFENEPQVHAAHIHTHAHIQVVTAASCRHMRRGWEPSHRVRVVPWCCHSLCPPPPPAGAPAAACARRAGQGLPAAASGVGGPGDPRGHDGAHACQRARRRVGLGG